MGVLLVWRFRGLGFRGVGLDAEFICPKSVTFQVSRGWYYPKYTHSAITRIKLGLLIAQGLESLELRFGGSGTRDLGC